MEEINEETESSWYQLVMKPQIAEEIAALKEQLFMPEALYFLKAEVGGRRNKTAAFCHIID